MAATIAKASNGPEGAAGPCKFFGSAKGCSNEKCPFSHDSPNSVKPCSFKQRLGSCERGEACTFRHVPWASAEDASKYYATREKGAVETSTKLYKQLHRDNDGDAASAKLAKEHVEGLVDREMQKETYGTTAVRMMEKMGYVAGSGLGKDGQGRARLVGPALELERASHATALGLGHFGSVAGGTPAERAARLADARAQKQRRVDEKAFVTHNLLSDDESSEGEESHRKARDTQLRAA